MKKLSEEAMKLLSSFDKEYVKIAQNAINNDKAFCPSCHWAGMSNCAHFDECEAFIMPDGEVVK